MPNVYSFPEDLFDNQLGHYMSIRSWEKQFNKPDQLTDVFFIYIPGGQTNGQSLTWQQQHEYTDVKLARLFTQALGVFGDVAAGAATLAGYPINPRVDVLFRNTNLREYQFMFLMAPQSQKEKESMNDIITRLRWGAAPRFVAENTFYQSPNEFEINFYYQDENGAMIQNTNIPRIAKGVIKRVDVDYTPTGEWSTFYDGSPVSALLTFTFLETKIIDKKYIEDGF